MTTLGKSSPASPFNDQQPVPDELIADPLLKLRHQYER